jgi:very-short-patch-repair endonuclease
MNYFGGEEKFKEQIEADALKNQKCKENGFTLFRVKYDYSDEDFYDLCVNIKEIINSKNVNDE